MHLVKIFDRIESMASDSEFDNTHLIDIPNYDNEVIRVMLSNYNTNKRQKLDIRRFYKDKTTGEYCPTTKGVAFTKDQLKELVICLSNGKVKEWLYSSKGAK